MRETQVFPDPFTQRMLESRERINSAYENLAHKGIDNASADDVMSAVKAEANLYLLEMEFRISGFTDDQIRNSGRMQTRAEFFEAEREISQNISLDSGVMRVVASNMVEQRLRTASDQKYTDLRQHTVMAGCVVALNVIRNLPIGPKQS